MAKKNKGGGSLQDQLRAAGLVTEKQVKKAKKNIHSKEVRVKHGEVDEVKLAAEKARSAKAKHDREINLQRDQVAQEKALAAQIKQLIEMNRHRQHGDVAYNFTEDNKVKKIYISELNKQQINKGFLAIVKFSDSFELVPAMVAKKIMDRQADAILYLYDASQDEVDEDDPYKDFPIPDDLEW